LSEEGGRRKEKGGRKFRPLGELRPVRGYWRTEKKGHDDRQSCSTYQEGEGRGGG